MVEHVDYVGEVERLVAERNIENGAIDDPDVMLRSIESRLMCSGISRS